MLGWLLAAVGRSAMAGTGYGAAGVGGLPSMVLWFLVAWGRAGACGWVPARLSGCRYRVVVAALVVGEGMWAVIAGRSIR